MISYDDFLKMDIRIGRIESAEKVEGADKLIRLVISFSQESRQIVAAMAEFFSPEYFIGKEVPVLLNLPYRKFRGIESQGMILAADVEGRPVLLHPEQHVPPGSRVK
ncbi:methionine--tRNA ligase [bacterium AH-315-F18]|nr:methionine--tRNA ligase [bacterium AH-315-F18]